MKETKNLETLLSEMDAISAYFKHNIKNDPLFSPEFTVSAAINKRFRSGKPVTRDTAKAILRLMSKLKPDNHYNGTGWLDYRMHLNGVFQLLKISDEIL
jgi:hypothetical protein